MTEARDQRWQATRMAPRVAAAMTAGWSSGSYQDWFAKLDATVVLVRPDFQVYGASADPLTPTAWWRV